MYQLALRAQNPIGTFSVHIPCDTLCGIRGGKTLPHHASILSGRKAQHGMRRTDPRKAVLQWVWSKKGLPEKEGFGHEEHGEGLSRWMSHVNKVREALSLVFREQGKVLIPALI